MAREGVVVDSSFPGRSFLGGGASDCGTLTIRCAAEPSELVLLQPSGWVWNASWVEWIVEARCWVLRNRAGSLRRDGLVFLGHLSRRGLCGSGCGGVAGAGLHHTAVKGFLEGCLFSLSVVAWIGWWCSGLVFLPVF